MKVSEISWFPPWEEWAGSWSRHQDHQKPIAQRYLDCVIVADQARGAAFPEQWDSLFSPFCSSQVYSCPPPSSKLSGSQRTFSIFPVIHLPTADIQLSELEYIEGGPRAVDRASIDFCFRCLRWQRECREPYLRETVLVRVSVSVHWGLSYSQHQRSPSPRMDRVGVKN